MSRSPQLSSPAASAIIPASSDSAAALQHQQRWWHSVNWRRCLQLYLQPAYEALVAVAMLGCLSCPTALQALAASAAAALYADILPAMIAAIAGLLTAALLSLLCTTLLTCWQRAAAVLRGRWRVSLCCTLTPQLLSAVSAIALLLVLPTIPFSSSQSAGQAALLLLLWLIALTRVAVCAVSLFLQLIHIQRPPPLSCPWMPAWYTLSDDVQSVGPLECRSDVVLTLQSIAPVKYRSSSRGDGDDGDNDLCVICIEQLKEGDSVRRFSCRHCFHARCVDDWLVRRLSCPLCLAIVDLPTPAAAASVTMSVVLSPAAAASAVALHSIQTE